MKNIITGIFISILIAFALPPAFAQANKKGSFSMNFGPEVTFPEFNFSKTHYTGFGGSIKSEYTFGKHGSVILNSGFALFNGRQQNILQEKNERLLAIPVKAGARYYMGTFYVQGETGVVFMDGYRNNTNPIFSIGAGDKLRLGRQIIDISLRQEIWLNSEVNYNMAVLRVAYEIVW